MTILIIEDEIKTARALSGLITAIKPAAKILAIIQSIETAVSYLSENPVPDLIFMDIQLADGLSFDIFKKTKVISPVIFCTAYDDYAIEAFRTNGIDYILKPFSKESISAAFAKNQALQQFFRTDNREGSPPVNTYSPLENIEALINRTTENSGKRSFLVFKHNKYVIVPTESIACFCIKNDSPTIVNFEAKEFSLTQSLDEIHQLLNPNQFFRVNRQYLINFKAVLEVEHYFSRKLFVRLLVDTPEKVLVGKEKVTAFLSWLENR